MKPAVVTIAGSIILIVVGAILRFAVTWTANGIDIHVVGDILMAGGGQPDHHADPDVHPSQPHRRAQAQLDYGEWLRRQRRINDAKPVLTAALETFRRLGAAPWSRRAEAELRACGVTAAAATAPDGAGLAALTPQQREIVVLAGRGLTNGEIADRLYLSPRTVASHLYRSYPKLGIAGRHQLAALIARSGTDPGAAPGAAPGPDPGAGL